VALCPELRPARLGNTIVIERAVAAAAAAAIAAVEVIFFGQDHQTVFVKVEVFPFNQLFHGRCGILDSGKGAFLPCIRGGLSGLAGGIGSSFFILSSN